MRKFSLSIVSFAILLIISSKQAFAQVTIEIVPPQLTTNDSPTFYVKGLREDRVYALTIFRAGQRWQKKGPLCNTSSNGQVAFAFKPLEEGVWQPTVQENLDPTDTSRCDPRQEIGSREISVSRPQVQPPPGIQPPPAAGGAIDFSKLNKAVGLKIGGKTTGITIGDIVTSIVPILFVIAGLILLFYLIWGGFSLMLSKGDPKAVEAAKGRITNAIIGFVIIFVAYWLVQLLGLVFGVKQFQGIFGK